MYYDKIINKTNLLNKINLDGKTVSMHAKCKKSGNAHYFVFTKGQDQPWSLHILDSGNVTIKMTKMSIETFSLSLKFYRHAFADLNNQLEATLQAIAACVEMDKKAIDQVMGKGYCYDSLNSFQSLSEQVKEIATKKTNKVIKLIE